MICRFCSNSMGQKIFQGQTLDICAACGGIWIDKQELNTLLNGPAKSFAEKELKTLKAELEWSASYDGHPSRPCPKCAKHMPRHLFAALSGISIDYCATDGIWCDPGEFDRLVQFMEQGGLQLARMKAWQEALPESGEKPLPRAFQLMHRAASLFS